jgi:hypothetical protein
MSFFDSIYQSLDRPEIKRDYPKYDSLSAAIEAVTRLDLQQVRAGIMPVHLSKATKFCDRQHYLMVNSGRKFYTRPSVAQKLMWGYGRAAEKIIRDTLITAYGTENVYADWSCVCGALRMEGLGIDHYHVLCNVCKTNITTEHGEATLLWDDIIAAHPDLLLLNEANELEVIELKSISADGFKILKEPSEDYIKQGYGYVRLLEKNREKFEKLGFKVKTDSFRILYASKGFKFSGSVLEEFIIKVKDMNPRIVQDFNQVVMEIRHVKDTINLPERTKCFSTDCAMAKDCPVVAECFSGR